MGAVSSHARNGGGGQRMFASSSSKASPPSSTPRTKDVAQEAIDKSQRLHAELTEVCIVRGYIIRCVM